MIYVHAHQPDEIDRRDIIVKSGLVLPVICPARIADASLEPRPLSVSLRLHDELRARCVAAHEVVLEFLALPDDGSLMLRRLIIYLLDLPVLRKHSVQQRHHHLLVALVPEKRLETSVAEYVHILLLSLCMNLISHNKKIKVYGSKVRESVSDAM